MKLYEIASKKGSYAAVKFDQDTVSALIAYQKDITVTDPLGGDDFHTTVMYSTEYIPEYTAIGNIDPSWVGHFSHFDIFPGDEDNSLVMIFDCKELSERWEELRKDGATWDYPTYQAHITLSYNAGDVDPKSLPAYGGPINIINEYGEDLDPG